MCNDYRLEVDIASIAQDFDDLKIKINMPEGTPNVEAREDIKISDLAPIVRSGEVRGTGQLVNRRWSWAGQGGKPVYNFRSEGREFTSHRCLILADGFYEFTQPEDPKQKRKTKWLFTLRDHDWFCIAASGAPQSMAKRSPCSPPSQAKTSNPITDGRSSRCRELHGQIGSTPPCRPAKCCGCFPKAASSRLRSTRRSAPSRLSSKRLQALSPLCPPLRLKSAQ